MKIKVFILVLLGLFLIGCGGGSSNNNIQKQGLIDEKLLSCFDNPLSEDAYKTIEVFECHDIDLSKADLFQLSRLPVLKKLVLNNTNLSTLEALSTLTNLVYLDIENNYKGNGDLSIPSLDLSPISTLIKLKTLNLSKNYINDLSPLSKLVNLDILLLNEIIGQKVLAYNLDIGPVDLSPLSNLRSLTTLELSGNYINDGPFHLEGTLPLGIPFSGFVNLKEINESNSIQRLNISNSYVNINDSPNYIGSFTNLTHLNISDNLYNSYGDKSSTLTQLDVISGLRKLKNLDLHSNIIDDVKPLKNLLKLEYLDLSDNTYDNNAVTYGGAESIYCLGDLSPLVELPMLKTLILSDSFVTSSDLENLGFSPLVNIIL